MPNSTNIKEVVDKLCRELTDKGKLIEAGWVSLKLTTIPADAPQVQLDEMRNAFFAGAQHLFGSIMGILEPDAEPTEKDLKRMDLIHKELSEFISQFTAKNIRPGSRA